MSRLFDPSNEDIMITQSAVCPLLPCSLDPGWTPNMFVLPFASSYTME